MRIIVAMLNPHYDITALSKGELPIADLAEGMEFKEIKVAFNSESFTFANEEEIFWPPVPGIVTVAGVAVIDPNGTVLFYSHLSSPCQLVEGDIFGFKKGQLTVSVG